jgi:hypothetical protein
MGALTIAFDTTIVGALAFFWVLMVVHLFFVNGENRLGKILDWVKDQEQPAVVGVLLFAMTYTLGSAVSRMAQDLFNDDDLYLQVPGRLFRAGLTEDRIHTRVYCDMYDDHLLMAGTENPALLGEIYTFQALKAKKPLCWLTLRWSVRYTYDREADDKLKDTAVDIFSLQENALMVKGEDYTVRLRQIHNQIMVLRGAAFNGLIGFSLCVFALGKALRREKHGPWIRLAVVPVPALYFAVALISTVHHFGEREPLDPPYMEFTLLLLALVGAWLVWRPPSPPKAEEPRAKETVAGKKPGAKCDWQSADWARLGVLSAILSTAAVLGWWSTEVLYAQQVIYAYDSQIFQSKGTAAQK